MLKDRSGLEKYLIKTVIANISNKNTITATQKWCMELFEEYNIPIAMSSDILSQRKDLSEFNEFILFAVTDVLKPAKIKEYYTEKEIKLYTGKKYIVETVEFPIKLHLIQVTPDQFIGATSAKFLMSLREQQLINYNADTQRALKIMLKGGTKMLRPYINDKTVGEIDDCYASNTFIPNMISLNINPDDENAEWVYNEQTEMLSIRSITAFDIVDGYHRYLGMARNYDRNNRWDYPMMLQITMFPIGKARQMIYQENQKTKMKEEDLSAYNQYDVGNIVVNRLNSDPDSDLFGLIDLNDGLINSAVLAQGINKLYFDKSAGRKEAIETSKQLIRNFNEFIGDNTNYLKTKWNAYEILVVLYGFRNDYSLVEIELALRSISSEQADTLNRLKDINNKVLNILKEVYGNA